MDKEELRKRMSKAIGTFENRMVYNISNDCAEIALKYFTEQLNKPLVMQAEGSDVSEGAAVASEGQGEANMCADLTCIHCGDKFDKVTELWSHLDRCRA